MQRAKRLLLCILTAFFFLMAWLMIAYRLPGPAIVVSRETTFLIEPLHADGLPDYTRHLLDKEREGLTPENNGAIPFLQAMWPAGLDEKDYEPVCGELGMEIPRERGMGGPSFDEDLMARLAAWRESLEPVPMEPEQPEVGAGEGDEEELGELWEGGEDVERFNPKHAAHDMVYWALENPWRREEIPLLAEWVERQRPFYELLHEAAAKERFYCPSPDFLGTPQVDMGARFPAGHELRSAVGDCLGLRAHLALGEGDVAAAWRDCRAMFRLAGHVPREFMLGELISINTETLAHATAKLILSDPNLDVATAQEILEFFHELPPRGGMGELVDTWERMADLSYYIGMSQQGSDLRRLEDDDEEKMSYKSISRSLDWNTILRKINADYDEIRRQLANAEEGKPEEQAPAGWVDSDDKPMGVMDSLEFHATRKGRTELFIRRVARATVSGWSQALRLQMESNAERQLLMVAAALTVYRLEQGAYPERLTDLVPGLLPALPADPFHGSPPVYRRTGEGFLLYSLGPNGVDDGGTNERQCLLEGVDVDLYQLEVTLENENHLRELLGRPAVTDEEFAELESARVEGREEIPVVGVKRLVEEIPAGADDHAMRLPLPRLILPSPGSPPPQE